MVRALLTVFLTCCYFFLFSQSVPKLKRLGDKHFSANQFSEAINFYEKVVGLDKKNYETRYKLGLSYYRTLQYENSKKHFRKVMNSGNAYYAYYATYYYGNVLKLESDFATADSVYADLTTQPGVDDELLSLTRKQMEGCRLALNQKKENRGFVVNEMEELNSQFHDFGAVLNPAEKTLVFVTTRNIGSTQYKAIPYGGLLPDLIQYSRKNDKWRNVSSKNKFDIVNSKWSEGSGSFTADGKLFFFTSCQSNDGSDCKIMLSKLIKDEWTDPVPLNSYINLEGTENKHPYVTQSGDTLFFASDREGGLGGSDIWMSLRGLEEDSWTPAINLGDAINTTSNEITPYYSSAFGCLLFASDGHVGYGGFDLFAAKGESFFEPQIYNLGDPFNTPSDDTYFHIADSAGHMASNRKDRKNLNLYSFKVSNERLYLSLLISGESLIDERIVARYKDIRSLDLTTFRVEDYQGFEVFEPIRRKPKPKILDESPFDTGGVLLASNEQYESTGTIGLLKGNSDSFSEFQFSDLSAEEDRDYSGLRKAEFEKVYFKFGSATLTYQAKLSLDRLIEQMQKQPQSVMYIHIIANTDDVGTSKYNLGLSGVRGNSIREYIISKGFPPENIAIQAEGEKNLIARGTSWYDRLFNRRAEVYVYSPSGMDFEKSRKLVVRINISVARAADLLQLPIEKLKNWNGLQGDRLVRGQIIRIDENIAAVPIKYFLDEVDVKYNFFPYKVKPGDTMTKLAKKFGTPEELIAEINQLHDGLKAGEEIFVYKVNF